MKSNYDINSFTAGELSPRLSGRNDIKWYKDGCKKLENMNVYVQGAATKRPGTYYISTTRTPGSAVKVVKFNYSNIQSYVLEFGDEYMRVYKDGGIVLDAPGGDPYYITSPYTADELFDLRFAHTADTLYIVHPDHTPKVLTRYDHNDWEITDVEFYGGPFLDQNVTDVRLWPSGSTGSVTIVSSSGIFDEYYVGALLKLEGPITNSFVITAEDQFTEPLAVDNGQTFIVSLSDAWTATMTLQRSTDFGATWIDYGSWTGNTSYPIIDYNDNVMFRLGCKAGNFTSGTCTASLTIQSQWGYCQITAVSGSTVLTADVKRDLPVTTYSGTTFSGIGIPTASGVTASGTTQWSEGAWNDVYGYPSEVCFSNQRLVMAATYYQPQTFWGSQVGDFVNFYTGTGLDDESFAFTINSSDVNTINWLYDGRALFGGTDAAEYKLSTVDSILTPTTPAVSKQSSHGSANIKAIGVGSAILFLQDSPSKLRTMMYDYKIDGWLSNEISLKAEHLLREGNIVDWDYAEKPDNVLYMVLDTGDMIACTCSIANEAVAFSKITTTSGSFESVATIPGYDRDEVWVVVNRGGSRYVEQFTSPFWTDQTDYIFMDSTLTYAGNPKATISGLEHLEGCEVTILIDGAVHPNRTVSNGTITLQENDISTSPSTVVHVGLPYTATLQTMKLVPQSEFGLSIGKRQCAYDLQLTFYKTIGCRVGIDEDNLKTLPRFTYPIMNQAPIPYTGMVQTSFNAGYEDEIYITLTNDQPLPFTVLHISTTVQVNVR